MRLPARFPRPFRRGLLALAAIGTALVIAVPAFADNVENDVVASGNGTVAADAVTTVGYLIDPNSAGSRTGCDAADGSPLTLTINAPVAVTVTPRQLVFTSCAKQTVQMTSATAGTYEITVSGVDAAGTYNYNPARFTLTVTEPVKEEPTVTAPVLAGLADQTLEATGPNGAAATFAVTASDEDGSVEATCDAAPGTFALGTTTVSCSATNAAGTTTGSFTVTVQDTTAPDVTVSGHQTVFVGQPITWSANAVDLVDGAITPTCDFAQGHAATPGTYTVTCSASDTRGNGQSRSFDVTATFDWTGILQPVNANGTSTFKAGSTVPVKFRLQGYSGGTSAVATIQLVKLDGSADGTVVESTSTAAPTTGTTFRYDAADDQYIYNLGTKKGVTGDFRADVTFNDGAPARRSQKFSLR